MEYPNNWEQLTKHERKEFKRNYYHEQLLKQYRTSSYKKHLVYTSLGLFLLLAGYLLVKELSKPQPGEFLSSLGNKHIQNVTDTHDPYNSIPPTSGTHVGGKANWGISDKVIPDELQLHNLEDGGVGIQYNCTPSIKEQDIATPSAGTEDECNNLIDSLTTIAKKYPDKVFMAPYPKSDSKIALTAWTRIDKFNDFDQKRIETFIKAFKGIDHH
jgi:hypothetical protein